MSLAEGARTVKPRLLYLFTDPAFDFSLPTGATTHILEMIEAFQKLGHEVKPVFGASSAPRRVRAAGRRILPARLRLLLRDYSYLREGDRQARALIRLAELWKPGWVYERLGKFQIGGAEVSRKMGIPLVVEYNASIAELERYYGVGLKSAALDREERTIAAASLLVVVSKKLQSTLLERGVAGEKILVLPNAVAPAKLMESADPNKVRRRFGLEGVPVIGFMGNFAAWHGTDNLLELIGRVSRRAREARFLIVGGAPGNPLYDRFRRRLSEEGLRPRVSLAGSIPHEEVGSYLSAMDVALIPDATEYGSPVKTFEYMAAGKAVIAPRVGPIEEVIQDGETGVLFERNNVEMLVEKTMRLLGDPAERERLGLSARDYVLKHHTWERNAGRVLEELARREGGSKR